MKTNDQRIRDMVIKAAIIAKHGEKTGYLDKRERDGLAKRYDPRLLATWNDETLDDTERMLEEMIGSAFPRHEAAAVLDEINSTLG